MKTGVLLINLGTPKSPKPGDVYKYLIEFLTDPRVMNLPWLQRQLLVRGAIVPKRYKQSAKAYEAIWTDQGSPLMIHGNSVKARLQKALGNEYVVELAMRYQEPSISDRLALLMESKIEKLVIVPLFPQYASATTGSVYEKLQESLTRYKIIPHLSFINSFATNSKMISAFCAIAAQYQLSSFDHILISFHGLPMADLQNENSHCRCDVSCCRTITRENQQCYSAQCYSTADALVNALQLNPEQYSICFQSRLGKAPWLQPYTSDVIKKLAMEGKKKVLVFCPSFVCDCLETIFEIEVEYQKEFQHYGGEKLQLVGGLNDHPLWIEALKELCLAK